METNMDLSSEVRPKKTQYRFHEVATLTDIKPYVLRFWESEFVEIAPKLDDSGVKFYSAHDIETIQHIKKLLFVHKLSIPQAKLKLSDQVAKSESNELTSVIPVESEAKLAKTDKSLLAASGELKEKLALIRSQLNLAATRVHQIKENNRWR